jgi:hypothetical protein
VYPHPFSITVYNKFIVRIKGRWKPYRITSLTFARLPVRSLR